MDKKNMRKLRDAIADEDAEFDMDTHWQEGKPSCFAGHACALGQKEGWDGIFDVDRIAREFLDLTIEEAWEMFYPGEGLGIPETYAATKTDAIRYLNNCIRTGSVYNKDH